MRKIDTLLTQLKYNLPAVLSARRQLRSAAYLGQSIRLWGRAYVKNMGTLIIGNRVRMEARVVPIELGVGEGATLEIGASTFINYGTSIGATLSVRIGPNCNIGTYVTIIDNDFHRLEPELRLLRPPSAPVIIEENVWLGARVIVLPGVTIGTGSVIGAGSVVARSIPSRSLAVGVPARVIRSL